MQSEAQVSKKNEEYCSVVADLRPSDASRWPLTRGSIGSRGGATGAVPFRRRYVRYCTVPPTAPLAPKTRRL